VSVLFIGVAINAFATPPRIPDTVDLPTRLIDSKGYDAQVWPFDLASNVLFGVGFVALELIGVVLPSLTGRRETSIRAYAGALALAGVLGVGAELIYVGARSQIINIGYCDCGFKNEEAISQLWALNLVQGAQSWLVTAAAILIAVGFVGLAIESGPALVSSRWTWWSLVTAAVIVLRAALSVLNIAGDAGNAIQGIAAGILIPVWAVWLGWSAGMKRNTGAAALSEPTAGAIG
jgi:hypothetical protein